MFHTKYKIWSAAVLIYLAAALTACGSTDGTWTGRTGEAGPDVRAESVDTIAEVPEYEGMPYVEINDNKPEFAESELTTISYENYSELDSLGRCGVAEACIGEDLMPDEEREDISEVKPTGWENREYDIVDGGYVYNRCHLIGFQLSGENANEENLITGTRYMNTEGMLPFENMVAEYVQETDNHVMYRVTPVFEGNDLVASGVQMEAESVEDDGAGICFNIYVYNVQPEITIDYSTGANWAVTEEGGEAGFLGNLGRQAVIDAGEGQELVLCQDLTECFRVGIAHKNDLLTTAVWPSGGRSGGWFGLCTLYNVPNLFVEYRN